MTLIFWRQQVLSKGVLRPYWIAHNSAINYCRIEFTHPKHACGLCDGLNGNPSVWRRACCFDSILLDLHILSLELINHNVVICTAHTCFLFDYHIHIRRMHTYAYTEFCMHIALFQSRGHCSSSSPQQWVQKEDKVHSVSVDIKKMIISWDVRAGPLEKKKHTKWCVQEAPRVWLLIVLCKSSGVASFGRWGSGLCLWLLFYANIVHLHKHTWPPMQDLPHTSMSVCCLW